jgi:hypothetical protein
MMLNLLVTFFMQLFYGGSPYFFCQLFESLTDYDIVGWTSGFYSLPFQAGIIVGVGIGSVNITISVKRSSDHM